MIDNNVLISFERNTFNTLENLTVGNADTLESFSLNNIEQLNNLDLSNSSRLNKFEGNILKNLESIKLNPEIIKFNDNNFLKLASFDLASYQNLE
jgi:hypothetical protein